MTAHVADAKRNSANGQLVDIRIVRWRRDAHAAGLEHPQQRCLAGIVQAQKQQFCFFVDQIEINQNALEPVGGVAMWRSGDGDGDRQTNEQIRTNRKSS